MQAHTLKEIRLKLGLSQDVFAHLLGLKGGRSIRYYESGEKNIPGTVALLAELFAGTKTIEACLSGK